jgi:hypothetical protein
MGGRVGRDPKSLAIKIAKPGFFNGIRDPKRIKIENLVGR